MSALESEVKPAVVPLVTGETTVVSGASLPSLARWVTVKTIVAEHSTRDTALTPLEDRRAVSAGVVPSYFRIFAALHSSETKAAYYRDSTTVSHSVRGPEPALPDEISRNIQVTAFLLGPVFFYVTAARVASLDADILDPIHPMCRLWPERAEADKGYRLPSLGVLQISAVSQTLTRLVQDPRVRYGGPLRRSTTAT